MKFIKILILFSYISISFILYSNEITDHENQLKQLNRELEEQKKAARDAEEKQRQILQSKNQSQRQLNLKENQIKELEVAGQNLRNSLEQSKNLLNQTERLLSNMQLSFEELMLYLLFADQQSQKLRISTDDSFILTLCLNNIIEQNRKVNYDKNKIYTETHAKEKAVIENLNKTQDTQSQILSLNQNLKKVDSEIETLESQKRAYQRKANELERNAVALQRLINELKTNNKRDYQETFKFASGLEMPVNGTIITPFGPLQHETYNISIMSNGIDIAVLENTPVKAIAEGQVVFADIFTSSGRMIIIDHKNGYHSIYSHLNSYNIKKGDNVSKGQIIGNSGRIQTDIEPCLHFEIRQSGTPVDPMKIFSQGMG
jgi:murein DD-endopeptidase MepM/ murein hydrolase activator NlpD